MTRNILFFLCLCFTTGIKAQTFTDVTGSVAPAIPGLQFSTVTWADYDNDGDLDFLIAGGSNTGNTTKQSLIYRYGGASFTNSITLPGSVTNAASAWGDYDNDGDLDLLLTGSGFTYMYRNDGGTGFTDVSVGVVLPGVESGSVAWADYDNDGDLDFLLTGLNGSTKISRIYTNTGSGQFVNSGISLDGVSNSSVAWGDYDNDGDQDILLAGFNNANQRVSYIYSNGGNGTFAAANVGVTILGVENGSVAWGDYDNDGFLDVILTGRDNTFFYITKLYHNKGDGTFEDIVNSLPAIINGSVAWGDCDNDGDLDLLFTGELLSSTRISQVYRNDGAAVFVNSHTLTGVSNSTAAWADYDNDNDLDIITSGYNGTALITNIYRNDAPPAANTIPTAPTNLNSIPHVDGVSMILSWDKTTDTQTPQNGLNYNVYISDVAGQGNLKPAMSDILTGFRKVVKIGNTGSLNTTTIKGLQSNKTYYWSVQAVDGAFAGSPFAPEQNFQIIVRTAQTITISNFTATYGDADFTPAGSASSSLPLSFSSDNASVADVVAGKIHVVGAGTANITVSQVGNASYFPAPDVIVTITVSKKTLTVTADDITITYGDAAPLPGALSYSITGFVNPETEAVFTTPVSITRDVATDAGQYNINVSGAAAANYDFSYVPGSFTILPAAASITFNAIPAKIYGDNAFSPGATVSNGLPVTYTSSDPLIAYIDNGLVYIVGIGSVTITASQDGTNNNYEIATDVDQTLTIGKRTLTFTAENKTVDYGQPLPTLTYTSTGFAPGENENALLTPVIATTDATTAIGVYTITLSGATADNYDILFVPATLTIQKATINISFASLPAKTYGDADFAPGATISNGLPITYTSDNSSVATIVGGNIHIVGAGTATITAHQVGDANYNPSPDAPLTLTVNKKQLTVIAEDKSINFGDPLPTFTHTITGFIPGETEAVLTTPVSVSATGTNVGTYPITASGAAAANYDFVYQPGILTIGKATAQISFSGLPVKTYGDADFAPGATIPNGLPITYISSNTNVATIVGGNIHIVGAGSTTITAQQAGNGNYNPATDVPVTLTVNKKQLTVTASNQTISFGDALPTLTYIITGFINPDTEATFTTPVSVSASGTNVGTYPITVSGGVAANYTFNYVAGILTIVKATANITFTALPVKTYGDADFAPGATISSGLPITYTSDNSSVATIVNGNIHITGAGSATITAHQAGNGNYNAATDVPVTLTVNKKQLTVTAENKTINYGEALPTLTYIITGFAGTETQAVFTTPVSITATGTNVGTYPITASGAVAANYLFNYIPGILTIGKATVQISFTTLPVKTYGDADFSPGATIASGLPITYISSNTNVATIAGGNIHIVGAGTTTITAQQAGNTNYNVATDVPVTLTVNKKQLTVTAADKTQTYGDPTPVLTYTITGFVNPDTEATFTAPVSISATGTNVGTYPIIPSGAAAANYTFNYVNGTLTIGKATAQITFTTLPTKTYGDADFAPGATISSSLPITYTSTGVATIVNGNIHITGAGTATITAHQVGNGNYNPATDVSVTLTVNKKQLTVTANDKTINYGEALPTLTYTITGLVSPDTEAAFTTPVTITTNAGTAVGVYNITATGAAAANYSFVYQPGTLTIQKATAAIIFNALQKTYGDADFAPGATISSGLPITYTSTGVATIVGNNIHITGAGTATITAHQAGNANYNAAADVSVTLTVNKKTLTVTADDKTKVYGQPNPVFTYTITGFVFGETEAVFTTPISINATGTTGGTHPITASGAAAANYTFTYVNGILTIQKAAQTITFATLPAKTYGDADFAAGATVTSGLGIIYTSSDPNVATIVNGNIHIVGAGTVTITATQPGDGNYNAATAIPQQLVIAKAAQTISFGTMIQRTAGEPPFDPGATASSGLPITYVIENTTIATINGNLISALKAGITKVTATQPGNNNYLAAIAVEQSLEVTGIIGYIKVNDAVTPNGDGINDFLMIEGIRQYPDNQLYISNANGKIVFEARGYNNTGNVFRGLDNKGNKLTKGVHYYVLIYQGIKQSGFFVLEY
ncbi:MBG domain-containing protein [Chitinophaga sp. SYP-B3965]|uniref:MBG domain-containing protein n=1 Tax=Chitinophaga sp. SYP-B3965 TaxID=2663120 RepID=UPI00156641D3|nr:MBG domain-containing protein [Chitinophaga sp. SYP-B3965]